MESESINGNLVTLKLMIKDFWDMTSRIVVHIYKRTRFAFQNYAFLTL